MTKRQEQIASFLYYSTIIICMTTFAVLQTFGEGPDEINRYKIVEYIAKYGRLPHGSDIEVRLYGYGASYAYQPILTYIIQGYLLRALSIFSLNSITMLIIARMVNVLFGIIMAYYIKKLSKLLFHTPSHSWLFTIGIMLLPQTLFLHTYVNTDSMAAMAATIIIYASVNGTINNYSPRTLALLGIGISLCMLSYYNYYVVIVSAIIIYIGYFYSISRSFSYKIIRQMLIKGSIILSIVLVLSGWWFIRNAYLYNGDFLALNARELDSIATALPEFNPLTRWTYAKSGLSLRHMIFETGYYTLVWKSFIAMFGPMNIPTHHYIYVGYKYPFTIAVIGLIVLCYKRKLPRFTLAMLSGITLTIILALYYSYTWEFQPQGRYYHPMIIPFVYLLVTGLEYSIDMINRLINKNKLNATFTILTHLLLYSFIIASLLYSVFCVIVPYYTH